VTFRSRLLLACLPLAIAPLAFFGLRTRAQITATLEAQYEQRAAALADVIQNDLEREAVALAVRLERLERALLADNRFRRAVLEPRGAERAYLLDYAETVMPLASLDVLRIQDEEGRVLSSGHFRNEFDAVDAPLPAALARRPTAAVLVSLPTPAGSVQALVVGRQVRVGPRVVTLVGGTAIDQPFLARLAGGTGRDVRREPPARATPLPGSEVGAYTRAVSMRALDGVQEGTARFVVSASTAPLEAVRSDLDRWLLAASAGAGLLALLLAAMVATRVTRPLTDLARRAARLDLDRLDGEFDTHRDDEIGDLARVLDIMTHRLRTGVTRLREAERSAAVGEIARQVHHDIRNGLVPIRNVVAHLADLAREQPDELPAVFQARQGTLESSVQYLHSLAGNYARLSPKLERQPCDLNEIVRDVLGDARSNGAGADVVAELAPRLPSVQADPVALRRILENLVVNGLESLGPTGGRVIVSTDIAGHGGEERVLLAVTDTGRGLSAEERARIFEHFHSTKPGGTGLGLSIVRRLVDDLGGRLAVASEPGQGSRFVVELPT
jgi:signal transduction histidine kinase